MRWVPPPNWPTPPRGWRPPAGWQPDLSWGPAPEGWQFWQSNPQPLWQARSSGQTPRALKAVLGVAVAVALLAAVGAAVGSDPAQPDATAADSTEAAASSPVATATPGQVLAVAPTPSAPPPSPRSTPRLPTATTVVAGSALALLDGIEAKGRAAKTGYDRDLFGQRWADTDRNGCDTRNDILARDLTKITYKPGTGNCKVLGGTLVGSYTRTTIIFSIDRAQEVHIDHVVALSDAWQKGAQQWEPNRRLAFANDPLNLLAVHGPTNSSKGDSDAASWLPPNKAFRCRYVARQVAVKAKYDLWMTAAEKDASRRVLDSCPNEPAPSSAHPTLAPGGKPAAPAPAAPQSRQTGGASDPDYGTCKDAKAAGKGPYYADRDPEYAYYRDGDGDGVACE